MQREKMRGLGRLLRAFALERAKAFRVPGVKSRLSARKSRFACVALPLAIWLGHTGVERALLAGPVLLILIVELLNSAIEATVDRIGLERHVLAGLAKDIGSAAVMLSFILLGVMWLLVLLDR